MRLEMSGVTVDMSKGGILATVDQSISPGVRCRVDLTPTEGEGPTESLWGRVRRTNVGKNGFVVALEFDEPVKALAALGAPIDEEAFAGPDNGDGLVAEQEAVEPVAEEVPAEEEPA